MREAFERPQMRVLTLICGQKLAQKAEKLLAENRIPVHYLLRGRGAASSEMMDMLGLGSTAKAVTVSIMPKQYADAMLKRLSDELGLNKPGTGVVFTTAINGISSLAMKIIDEDLRKEIQKGMENDTKQLTSSSDHSLIVATVNQGYSDEVVDAARTAGARGGTVLSTRQAGGEKITSVFGIPLQEEREMLLIVSDAETKLAIMKEIGESFGMRSEARGLIFSVPIDMIAGLDTGNH